jgi:hypothetical protein
LWLASSRPVASPARSVLCFHQIEDSPCSKPAVVGRTPDTRHQTRRRFSRTRGNGRVTMRTQRPRIFRSFRANIVTPIFSASFVKNVRPQRARGNFAETSTAQNLISLDKSPHFCSGTFRSTFEEHHRAQFQRAKSHPMTRPPQIDALLLACVRSLLTHDPLHHIPGDAA